MKHLQGLNVLILGLGDSGLAMARWCARCGVAGLQVADTREAPPQAGMLREQLPQAVLHTGVLDPAWLEGVNLLLKSPGLSPLDAQLAPLLARADELGIPVRGELSLFASALADLKAERQYTPKVIAITGTNGKTTTTSLTAQLVERCGLRVGLAGNIGPTLLDTLGAALRSRTRAGRPRRGRSGRVALGTGRRRRARRGHGRSAGARRAGRSGAGERSSHAHARS